MWSQPANRSMIAGSSLPRGSWNQGYLEELCAFPLGALKDQVDATSGAFNHPTAGCSWTLEEIRAFGRNQVIGDDPLAREIEEAMRNNGYPDFEVERAPSGELQRPDAGEQGATSDASDWHAEWLREVERKQAGQLRRLRRGGR